MGQVSGQNPFTWNTTQISTVTGSSIKVFDLKANRSGILFYTKKSQLGIVYIGPDSSVSSSDNGIVIYAGGSFLWVGDPYCGEVWARAEGANVTLFASEFVE